MKNTKIFNTLFLLSIAILSFSCSKDDDDGGSSNPSTPNAGTVTVELEHVWGSNMADFNLNEDVIHPKTGDTLNYSMFKYYITNIQLMDDEGNWWAEDESYHLVNLEESSSLSIDLEDVPGGTYTTLSYMIGVDSTRNVSGVQEGDLDPALGMFWSWTTGYIMVKAEGTSSSASNGSFAFHLGGFTGDVNTVNSREHTLSTALSVDGTSTSPMVHLSVNPARFWHTADGLSTTSTIHMPSTTSALMAYDFATGINVSMVHN